MKTPARVNDNVSLRNVLFATDFSAASMKALPYVTSIARRFDSKVCVAHVVPPEDYPSGLNSLDEAAQIARGEAELKMSSLLNSAPCRDLACEGVVGNGDIWIGLSDFMRRNATDLLVMGTIGRTGVRKFLLGSVAEEAMRESPCPVLTVGPECHAAEEIEFRNILYATDFSADSLAAAPYALAFSKNYRLSSNLAARVWKASRNRLISMRKWLKCACANWFLSELISGPSPKSWLRWGRRRRSS